MIDMARHKKAGLIHRFDQWIDPKDFEVRKKVAIKNLDFITKKNKKGVGKWH